MSAHISTMEPAQQMGSGDSQLDVNPAAREKVSPSKDNAFHRKLEDLDLEYEELHTEDADALHHTFHNYKS